MEVEKKNNTKAIKVFCIICICVVSVLFYAYIVYHSYERGKTVFGVDAYFVVQNIIYGLLLILIISVCILVLVEHPKRIKTENLFLVSELVMGAIFLLLIPLMAVPDEYAHLCTAYDVSDALMGTHGDTVVMRSDDFQHQYPHNALTRSDINSQYEAVFQGIENAELVETGIVASQSPRYLFIVSALGISLGRVLGLSTTFVYLLGRLFNMLVFVAACYYAVKRMPFGKGVVIVWALLPITLQQVCSFSYDSAILTLSILVVATTLSAAYGEESDKKKKAVNYVVMITSCLLLLPCKGYALLPLVVFPFMLIPRYLKTHREVVNKVREKVRPWMKVVAICGVILVVCVAGIALARVIRRLVLPENINNNYIAWADHNGFTVGYFLKNPARLFEILLHTLCEKAATYLNQMLGGSLGWLEIQVPKVVVLSFLGVLIYVAMRKKNEEQFIKTRERVWMVLVFVGVSCLAVAAMLLYWTPNNSMVVEGVQGRYFLPVLVPGMLALRGKRLCVSECADQYVVVAAVFLHLFVATAVYQNIA